ncbi:MAG: phage portal protein [Woeseiaceae bacterium]
MLDDSTYSFDGVYVPINEQLRHQLRRMRARSRELAQDNDYAKRFLQLVKSNVVGTKGIQLQPRPMRDDGTLDKLDAAEIKRGWREWSRPMNCSVDGKLSWVDVQNLALESCARDGEILIHLVDVPRDAHGLRLRVIPGEYLDELQNGDLPNGNRIVMGIEYSAAGVVVAYHVRKNTVRAWDNVFPERDYIRLPAIDVIHLHRTEYADQARGVPWLYSAIRRLHMAGKYEEAELFAAYAGACKMGAYIEGEVDSMQPNEIAGDDDGSIDEDEGEHIEHLEIGQIKKYPKGSSFEWFDPTHPTTAFDGFMKFILQGAASGLGVANHSLTGNLSDVNFSSIRSGVLEDRENWRALQGWVVEHLHERVYDRWIRSAMLNGKVKLPFRKLETKYLERAWQPRGWPGIDPKKESDSHLQNIKAGLDSRTNILAQQGRDIEDVYSELEQETARAAELGISIEQLDKAAVQVKEVIEDED